MVLLTLALVAFVIFGYALKFGFVLDDESQIVNNLFVQSIQNLFGAFSGSTMDSLGARKLGGIYYKPIMTVCYMLLWTVSHHAWIFHFFQLLLHIINSFLIFNLFNIIGKFSKYSSGMLLCFVLALGFLVHPVNVEAVVYIADLQDVLFSLFGLLALNLLASYQTSQLKLGFFLSVLLELSLLSKESGILYVIITGLFCLFFDRKKLKLWVYAASVAIVIYLGLRLGVAQLNYVSNSSVMMRTGFMGRLISVPKIIFHYFSMFLYPNEISLVQDWIVKDINFLEFWVPLLGLLGISTGVLFLLRKTKDPVPFFFLTWFILGMGAHSNLVALDGTVADRWFYFPMVGLLGFIGFYLNGKSWGKKYRSKVFSGPVSLVLLLVIFMSWSARSFARTLDWETALLLYRHDLVLMPDSFYLNNNVGVELFRSEHTVEALEYFKKSADLFPEWNVSWNNLGAAYKKLGNSVEAEKCFQKSVENGPSPLGYQNYAQILSDLGKTKELKTFMEERVIPIYPNNPILAEIYARSNR